MTDATQSESTGEVPEKRAALINADDDNAVISIAQRMRFELMDVIAPGGQPKDKKERLYLDTLRDVTQTAQSRITSNNQADQATRDRAVVEQLAEIMKEQLEIYIPKDAKGNDRPVQKPSSDRLTQREVPPELIDTQVSSETYSEFAQRTQDLEVVVQDDDD